MDEGGTLDFDDLMDTGDVFPGFEITKFTAANETDEKDDGVLRTPEHEKDEDDYIVSEHKTKHTVYGGGANDSSFSKMAEDGVKGLPGIDGGIDDKHGDSATSGDNIMDMVRAYGPFQSLGFNNKKMFHYLTELYKCFIGLCGVMNMVSYLVLLMVLPVHARNSSQTGIWGLSSTKHSWSVAIIHTYIYDLSCWSLGGTS